MNQNPKKQLLAVYRLAVSGVDALAVPVTLKFAVKVEMAKLAKRIKVTPTKKIRPLNWSDWDFLFERRMLARNDSGKVREIFYLLNEIDCALPRGDTRYNLQPFNLLCDAVDSIA